MEDKINPTNTDSEKQASGEDLHPQIKLALLEAQTRRHFLRSFTAGVGSMFLGTLASQYIGSVKAAEIAIDGTPRLDFSRDPASPLATLPPQFHRACQTHHLSAYGGRAQPIGTI